MTSEKLSCRSLSTLKFDDFSYPHQPAKEVFLMVEVNVRNGSCTAEVVVYDHIKSVNIMYQYNGNYFHVLFWLYGSAMDKSNAHHGYNEQRCR